MTNHLVLTVHDLPSNDHPSGDWYVDVGLGDALYDPLPLRAGEYEQQPFRLALTETPGGVWYWHLSHDPAGSFPGMAWRSASTSRTQTLRFARRSGVMQPGVGCICRCSTHAVHAIRCGERADLPSGYRLAVSRE